MKVINAGYEILSPIDKEFAYTAIERAARTCYKSENKISEGSAERLIKALIKNGHEAMLEHYSITVKFIVDRGVSHELVRHRVASFAQESTRYCNYANDKFGKELTFISPCFWEGDKHREPEYRIWHDSMERAEWDYFAMINAGAAPEEARAVLPMSIKTEVCMTANLREWRHFFNLRAVDRTGKAHPQMKEVAVPLLAELKEKLPAVFGDIN